MNTRRTLLTAALLGPALAAGIIASVGAGHLDDTAALKKNSTDFQAAWARHDAKAVAAFFAKDGDLIDPEGVQSSGSAAVENYFSESSGQKGDLARSTITIKKDSVRVLTPDVALQDWDVDIAGLGGPDSPAPGPMFHRVVVVSKKEGGQWKFAAARPGVPQPQGAMRDMHDKGDKPMKKSVGS